MDGYGIGKEGLDFDLIEKFRKEYEQLFNEVDWGLFNFSNKLSMYTFRKLVDKDKAHWVSEVNFGLRVFLRSKGVHYPSIKL